MKPSLLECDCISLEDDYLISNPRIQGELRLPLGDPCIRCS
jgi:hypothetical protein